MRCLLLQRPIRKNKQLEKCLFKKKMFMCLCSLYVKKAEQIIFDNCIGIFRVY